VSGRVDLRRLGLTVAAPALALALALALASLVLALTDAPPVQTFRTMLDYGTTPDSIVNILNRSTTYYLSALAVAIGFRMNLFNIGVDGQYRLAAMLSAYLGGLAFFDGWPRILHVGVILVSAVCLGAAWAGVAALLKVTRGVSEIISTIMLNAIATGVVAYLLNPARLAVSVAGSNNIGTRPIAESGRVGGLPLVPGTDDRVFGLVLLAVLAGVAYWFVVSRTRFGFDLRATGANPSAAVASGVSVKRMVVISMLLSGGVAGLVGMPQLLGASYSYSLDFPAGLGFTGIAIALLGRNHPVGIALGALLWAFLDRSAQILDIEGVPKEIVVIMQGSIVLSVVVAYELVRRYGLRLEQRRVGEETGTAEAPAPAEVSGARS